MTREEAMTIILSLPLGCDCSVTEYQKARAMAIKALEQEPKKWTLCSEQMPELNEEAESEACLITYKTKIWTGAVIYNVTIAHYGQFLLSSDGDYMDKEGWLTINGKEIECDNVIAWMPLPEPYKAESEDK